MMVDQCLMQSLQSMQLVMMMRMRMMTMTVMKRMILNLELQVKVVPSPTRKGKTSWQERWDQEEEAFF
jgi:hypothetical protein